MERKILRKRDGRFCEVSIKLENGRLSVSGIEGRIVRRAVAKREALDYWRGYFEETRGAIQEMNERCGSRCITPGGAAKYVLAHDGELRGLDIFGPESGKEVMICESCGQIRETIAEWFPEVVPLFAHHLNDMHAECEHQEKRGETWKTHPEAVCSDCGYRLGSAWLKRELPPEIITLAETVGA